MSKPWPPPPDLPSIQELLRAADPERHLAEGAPADEYEPEETLIFAQLRHLPTADLLIPNILPGIERIWQTSFALTPDQLAERRPHLLSFAKEVERFFGPESKPRTRADIAAADAP